MHRLVVAEAVDGAALVVVPRGRPPSAEAWSVLVSGLPPVERERIGPVYRSEVQHDSAIGWSLLSRLAAEHGVAVWRSSAGRPVADPPVDVSMTHGGGWVAGAAHRHGRVGVDIETAREVSPELARRCLSPAELGWLACAPGRDRQDRFTWLWTAKEAYLKAIGTGLSTDPRSFTVDCSDRHPRLAGDLEGRWLFRRSSPADAVCLTVCIERAS